MLIKKNSFYLFSQGDSQEENHKGKSKGKYFDFSSNFSSSTLGYNNTFLSNVYKKSFKKNFSFHSPNFCPPKKSLNFSFLQRTYPILKDSFFFLVDNKDLYKFLIEKKITLFLDDLDKKIEKDFLLIEQFSNTTVDTAAVDRATNDRINFNLFSDTYLSFNAEQVKGLGHKKNQKNILYINASFPDFSWLKQTGAENPEGNPLEENPFAMLIVGGKHPWGLDRKKLIIVKENDLDLTQGFSFEENSLADHFIYSQGIKYYHKKKKENNYSKVKDLVERNILKLEKNPKIEEIKSVNNQEFLCYKIVLKKGFVAPPKEEYAAGRVFINQTTFYFLNEVIYIHLPINISHNHLYNKFKRLREIIDQGNN